LPGTVGAARTAVRRGYPAELVSARLGALWPRLRDALDGLEPGEADEHCGQD